MSQYDPFLIDISDFKILFYDYSIETEWVSVGERLLPNRAKYDKLRNISIEKIPKGVYLPYNYYECGIDDEHTIEFEIPKTFDVKDKLTLNIWT